jgi:hypothetical protein
MLVNNVLVIRETYFRVITCDENNIWSQDGCAGDCRNLQTADEKTKASGINGNDCYHSAQKLLSSRLLSKNIKIRIYRSII